MNFIISLLGVIVKILNQFLFNIIVFQLKQVFIARIPIKQKCSTILDTFIFDSSAEEKNFWLKHLTETIALFRESEAENCKVILLDIVISI